MRRHVWNYFHAAPLAALISLAGSAFLKPLRSRFSPPGGSPEPPRNRRVSAGVSTTKPTERRHPPLRLEPLKAYPAMKTPLAGLSAIALAGFALLATGCVSETYETSSAPPYSGTVLPASSRVAIVMEFRGGEPSPEERAEVRALLADYLASKGSVLVEQPSDADYLVHAVLERRDPENPAEWTVVNTYSAHSLGATSGDDYRWPGGIIEDDFYETTRFTYIGFGVFYPIWFDAWDSPWHRGRVRVCPPPRRHDFYRDNRWRDERRWHRPDRWTGPRRPDSDRGDRRPDLRPGDHRPDDRRRDDRRGDDRRRPERDDQRRDWRNDGDRRPDAPNRPPNRPDSNRRPEDRRERDRINDGDRRPGGDRNSGDGRGIDRDRGGVNRRPGPDMRPPAAAPVNTPAVRPPPARPADPPPAVQQEERREQPRVRPSRSSNQGEPPLANPRPGVERPRTPPSSPPQERPRVIVVPGHGAIPVRPVAQPPAEAPKVQPRQRPEVQRPAPAPRREPTQRPEVRRSEAPRPMPPPPRREAQDKPSREDRHERSNDRTDDSDKNREDPRR